MKRRLISCILALTLLVCLLVPAGTVAANQVTDPACGVAGAGGSTYCQQDGSNPLVGPGGIITNIIKIISYISGVAAVVMIVVGGFIYISSGGDSNAIKSARTTIVYAIVGLIVLLVAQLIVQFVLNKL